jgi:hypothetical protein
MPPAFLSRAPDLVRLSNVVNVRAVSLSEGVRAGLSVAVIIALNEYLRACPGTTDSRRLTFRAGILDRGGER